MPSDQLRLDIAVVNGDAALRQLNDLDAKLRAMPQAAQAGASGVETAAARQAAAMEREALRATAAVDREARKAADAQIREINRANQAALKAFDDELARRERLSRQQAQGFFGSEGAVANVASTVVRGAALGVGYQTLGAVQAGLEGIGSAAVGMNSRLEQARIGFTTMLGSAEKADAFLKDLAQFAATTPFEFPELVTASQRMLAMGFTAEQVRPLLTAVGNAAAALGSGKEGIDRITTALGQMQAKTKVQAEEMRQLTEAGIPAWDILAKKLNTDVAGAMAAVEQRAVNATVFIGAFQEATKERYGDMMAQQARTYAGAMTTITDNTQMAIAQGFKPLFAVLTEATVAVADFTQTDAWTAWATNAAGAAGQVAAEIRKVSAAGQTVGVAATALIGPEAALVGQATTAAAQAAGVDVGDAFRRGFIGVLTGGTSLAAAGIIDLLAGPSEAGAAAEGQRIGGDYVQNVVTAIAAAAPQGAEVASAAIEGVVQDMMARGFSEAQAREVAALYWGRVAHGLADKRPDMENAGGYMSQAVADGILAKQHLVGTAAQDLAAVAGAALKANKGNLQAAITDVITTGGNTGFSDSALVSTIALTEQQADALKGLESALGTLLPAERAQYDLLLARTNAETVLNRLVADGRLTEEQRAAILERGQGMLIGAARAERDRAEALEQARTADLGGALAVQQHTEERQKAHDAALGGAIAIRTNTERLEDEKIADLGGALAVQQHTEGRNRAKEAALGGALAIQANTERLADEREADLGGALAVQYHSEARQKAHDLALGGAIAIRANTERLTDEKEAELGGAIAVRDHTQERERAHVAALGGEVAIRANTEALEAEKVAALGGYAAIADHEAGLQRLKNAAEQNRQVFASLDDRMSNYAKSTTPAAVAQSLAYRDALSAIDTVTKTLTNTQASEITALKNQGDTWGALDTAIASAKLGYQDIAGLMNGEFTATERLTGAIQRNAQARKDALQAGQETAAIQQANAQAIQATGAGPQEGMAANAAEAGLTVRALGPQMAEGFVQYLAEHSPVHLWGEDFIDSAARRARDADFSGDMARRYVESLREPMESIASNMASKFSDTVSAMGPAAVGSARWLEQAYSAVDTQSARMLEQARIAGEQANLGSASETPWWLAPALNPSQAIDQGTLGGLQALSGAAGAAGAALGGFDTNIESASDYTAGVATAMSGAGNKLIEFTAGTGQATHAAFTFGAALAEDANIRWKASQDNVQALRENTIAIAGFKTAVGLTYGQIYTNTATQSGAATAGNPGGTNQGIVNLPPGTYSGVPVVSPLTGGTLRGFASGGIVYEPSLIVPTRTMIPAAIMAENGPEAVGPLGRSAGPTTVLIQVAAGVGSGTELGTRPFWQDVVRQHIAPLLRQAG